MFVYDIRSSWQPLGIARQIGTLPPVSSLFAAFLGVNPMQHLLTPSGALSSLPITNQQILTGREFFPHLISGPFHEGLLVVFSVSAALSVLAALASLLRGGRYAYVRIPAADKLPLPSRCQCLAAAQHPNERATPWH